MRFKALSEKAKKTAHKAVFSDEDFYLQSEKESETLTYAKSIGINYKDNYIPWGKDSATYVNLDEAFLEEIYKKVFTEKDKKMHELIKVVEENEKGLDDYGDEILLYEKADYILQCDSFKTNYLGQKNWFPEIKVLFPGLVKKYKVRSVLHPIVIKEQVTINARTITYYEYDVMFLEALLENLHTEKDKLWHKVEAKLNELHRDILKKSDEIELQLMDKYLSKRSFDEKGNILK